MKRVMQVILTRETGGTEKHVLDLAGSLSSFFELGAVCRPGGSFEKALRAAGVKTFACDPGGPFDFKAAKRLFGHIRNFGAQIVHSHLGQADWFSWLASRNMAGAPALISTEHGISSDWRTHAGHGPVIQAIHRLGHRLRMRRADKIICVSNATKRILVRRYPGATGKAVVIHNGIAVARYDRGSARKLLGVEEDIFLAGTAGRMAPVKGMDRLVKAFSGVVSMHPRARLVLIGDGPLRRELAEQAASLGIEKNVIFTGYRPDVPRLMSALDVFVLPSLSENLSYSLMEAMNQSAACIATDTGGNPELLGDAGILVKPGDSSALTKSITRLFDDEETRKSMGMAARQRITNQFTMQRMTDSIRALYDMI